MYLGHRRVGDAAGQADGELRRPEHVHQARPVRQRLARRRAPDERPLSRLGHAEVASVQDAEADLRTRIRDRCRLLRSSSLLVPVIVHLSVCGRFEHLPAYP